MKRILIVDDEEQIRNILRMYLVLKVQTELSMKVPRHNPI